MIRAWFRPAGDPRRRLFFAPETAAWDIGSACGSVLMKRNGGPSRFVSCKFDVPVESGWPPNPNVAD
jgi:hypothetical protein